MEPSREARPPTRTESLPWFGLGSDTPCNAPSSAEVMRGVKEFLWAQGMLTAVKTGEISLEDVERMVRTIEQDGARRGANFAPGSKDAWLAALIVAMPDEEQGVSDPGELLKMQVAKKLVGHGQSAHDIISHAVAKTMRTVLGVIVHRKLDRGAKIPRRLVAPASALLRAFFVQLKDVGAARRLINHCKHGVIAAAPAARPDLHRFMETLMAYLYFAFFSSFADSVDQAADRADVARLVALYESALREPRMLALARGRSDFPHCREGRHPFPTTLLSPERRLAVELIAQLQFPAETVSSFVSDQLCETGREFDASLARKLMPVARPRELFEKASVLGGLGVIPRSSFPLVAGWLAGRGPLEGILGSLARHELASASALVWVEDSVSRLVEFVDILRAQRPALRPAPAVDSKCIRADRGLDGVGYLIAVQELRPTLERVFGRRELATKTVGAFLALFARYYAKYKTARDATRALPDPLRRAIVSMAGLQAPSAVLRELGRFALVSDAPLEHFADKFAREGRVYRQNFALDDFRAAPKRLAGEQGREQERKARRTDL